MQILDSIIVRSTREKGYIIPVDNQVDGMICVQHLDREAFYPEDQLENDEEQNNSSGFF